MNIRAWHLEIFGTRYLPRASRRVMSRRLSPATKTGSPLSAPGARLELAVAGMVRLVNFLREVLAVVLRAEGEAGQVRDADGVERSIRHDRELEAGETVKLVLGEDGSVVRVLDT